MAERAIKNVAVFVSGGGTNLQALIDAAARGELPHAKLALVVASRPGIGAIDRACAADIPVIVAAPKEYDTAAYDAVLLDIAQRHGIDYIVLAGFLAILGPVLLAAYPRRIINIHPSLIPRHCGAGMYGLRVHRSVLNSGDTMTGATVHFVDEDVDSGEILAQKQVPVLPDDTPETLQQRVLEQAEWQLLPRIVEQLCRGDYEEER